MEEPFPSPQQDATARVDAWKSASRLSDIKGAIPEMEDMDDRYCTHGVLPRVGHLPSYPPNEIFNDVRS